MKTRLITAGIGLAILGAILFLYNTFVFNIMAAIVCFLALNEAFNAFKFKKAMPFYIGMNVYAAAIMLTIFLGQNYLLPLSFAMIVYMALCLVIYVDKVEISDISLYILLSVMVVALFGAVAFIKAYLPFENFNLTGLYLIMIGLASAWGGDSSAYFAGRLCGKRKLAPLVSPNKTVEGAIGGVIGSMIWGLAVTFVWFLITGTSMFTGAENMSARQYIVIAIVCGFCSCLGILGDLFASCIKRHCKIKDYGTIFPGHGGILDRFDSVLLIIPFIAIFISVIDITTL